MNVILDIETTGLNPIEDKIICIVIKDTVSGYEKVMVSDDEKAILTQLMELPIEKTFTYCGDTFDIPFIIKRCVVHNVPIKPFIFNTLDIRKLVNSYKINHDPYVKGTLRDWAKILKLEVKTDGGGMMKDYFEKKMWVKIKEHCREDIELLLQLYNRCREVNLI